MTEVLTTGAEVIFRVKYVTLKMASAQVVKRQLPITVNSQDSSHPDDHFQSGYITPGFKPFSYILVVQCLQTS